MYNCNFELRTKKRQVIQFFALKKSVTKNISVVDIYIRHRAIPKPDQTNHLLFRRVNFIFLG
jgi:hypothetical protein